MSQQLTNGAVLGSIYVLFALGLTLSWGVLNILNLAHGAIFMVGSYVGLELVVRLGAPLWVAVAGAALGGGAGGALIDLLVLKRLRKRAAPHLIPMIATIGLAIALNNGVQGIFGADNIRFPSGLIPDEAIRIAGLQITVIELVIIFLSFALMAALMVVMKKTQLGRALRAIAESPKAAALLGINVEGLFLLTSFAAAALGGVAGVLIGMYSNAVFPLMGQPMLHKGIAVIILGGMGDIRGAMIGGLFLGFAEVLSVAYVGSNMRDAVAFGLLFLILLIRPQGLFGKVLERKA